MGVFTTLINEAEGLLKEGKPKKAIEIIISAWAYRESGILMAPHEALDYLRTRFPEKEALTQLESAEEEMEAIAGALLAELGMKNLPSAEL